MNGVCGSFSIFSSARYLVTNDEDYLWSALAFPLAGLMFDFLDGKVARWRNSSSLLGQELDSLADLVRCSALTFVTFLISKLIVLDIVWCCPCAPGVCCRTSNIPRYCRPYGIYLLWAGSSRSVQRDRCTRPKRYDREGALLRRFTYPIIARTCSSAFLLGKGRVD
jgi:hypothetical protein